MIKKIEFLNNRQKLRGMLYLRKKAPIVVISHGFTIDRTFGLLVFLAKYLYSRGYSVLTFNYRGSGDSEGEFTGIEGEVSDLEQAVKIARRHSRKVILLGYSFGCYVVALSKIKSKCAVLINPALSAELAIFSFLRRLIPIFLINRIFKKIDIFTDRTFEQLEATGKLIGKNFRFRLNEDSIERGAKKMNIEVITRIKSPVLIIQGSSDKRTLSKGARKAFEIAKEPKEFLWIEGADHGLAGKAHRRMAAKTILDWLEKNGLKRTA